VAALLNGDQLRGGASPENADNGVPGPNSTRIWVLELERDAGKRLAAGWDCLVRGTQGAHGAETLGRDVGAEAALSGSGSRAGGEATRNAGWASAEGGGELGHAQDGLAPGSGRTERTGLVSWAAGWVSWVGPRGVLGRTA